MNLLWMDVETTGLQPLKHEVIDLAFCLTDRNGEIISEYATKIKPKYPEFGDVQALSVNGFLRNRSTWSEAPDSFEAWDKVRVWWDGLKQLERVYPAGWNPGFDLGFIRSDCFEAGIQLYHHPLDLLSLVWFKLRDIDRPHLSDLCSLISISVDAPEHTAVGDVKRCVECYRRLTHV